jgi:hypothetical protein
MQGLHRVPARSVRLAGPRGGEGVVVLDRQQFRQSVIRFPALRRRQVDGPTGAAFDLPRRDRTAQFRDDARSAGPRFPWTGHAESVIAV